MERDSRATPIRQRIGRLAVAGWLAAPLHTAAGSVQDEGALWLERIDAAERIPHSHGVMRQTITTLGGSLRTFTIRIWSAENGHVSLMVYVDLPRVAGDKMLQLEGGDDFWYYMRRRDVTRHFAGHNHRQSAMGPDFS